MGSRPTYNAVPRPAPKALPSPVAGTPLGISFIDVARQSGLNAKTIYGGEHKNRYLLETTGCGVAFYDYDQDDWLDIFLVNGTRLEGFPKGQEPVSHLFKNNRDGTFTDVTVKAGLARSGWGQGCCVGDYNNDGWDDLFVSYYGQNVLYRNNGNGTFTDVTEKAGLLQSKTRWNSGCAFLDYDRDGHLDLFVANYIDFDIKNAPIPEAAGCAYKGIQVACGPPGLQGGKNILYHNNGDGTFTEVAKQAGVSDTNRFFGLGVVWSDFDNDGKLDLFVANDGEPNYLYRNLGGGRFQDVALDAGVAVSEEGVEQANMGIALGDYLHTGWMSIFITHFSDEYATLYRNDGNMNFSDVSHAAGIARATTPFVGWGDAFLDLDNSGWLDIIMVNGHVYPQVDSAKMGTAYREPKLVFQNQRDGTFANVSAQTGSAVSVPQVSRGLAVGDLFNRGRLDIVVENLTGAPMILEAKSNPSHHWVSFELEGTPANRLALNARVRVTTGKLQQLGEIRSGGSYLSQSDLRLHFGLDDVARIDKVEVIWPNGNVQVFQDVVADRFYHLNQGGPLTPTK